MANENNNQLPGHGASVLPSVTVDSYNLEIEDEDGFLGDKASKGAFWEILDKWRKALSEIADDPFGEKPSNEISRKKLAMLLAEGNAKQAALVLSAIEEFAQQLTLVIRRFMRLKDWRNTECIVIGGGFSESQLGQLAVGRSALLLKAEGMNVDLELIRNDPDEAGLIGSAHLLPAWVLDGYDAILALDIGGTNIRAGVVELNLKKSAELAQARVAKFDLWRHADEEPSRDDAVNRTITMLTSLSEWSDKEKIRLAPVVGIACPGVIQKDGSIKRGAQNLPGNWESSRFNLPDLIRERIPSIGRHDTVVVMHNDAVVQGLSELPHVKDRCHWAALTIGTGLGNVRFTNRETKTARKSPKASK